MKKDKLTKAFLLLDEISNIIKLSYCDLVSWRYAFDHWELGQVQNINGSSNLCLIHDDDHLQFSTIIPPGCSFDPHRHDFIEKVTVLSGEFYEASRRKTYFSGDVVLYRKYETHVPGNHSNEPCIIKVDFLKKS